MEGSPLIEAVGKEGHGGAQRCAHAPKQLEPWLFRMVLRGGRLPLLLLPLLWSAAGLADAESHRYCVIGAGPAGVQLGNFLLTADGEGGAGRDYVVLERAKASASFFSAYPVLLLHIRPMRVQFVPERMGAFWFELMFHSLHARSATSSIVRSIVASLPF